MKRTIVILAAMVIAAVSVNAQQPDKTMKQQRHQQFRHHGREMLAKKLNFSDQQKDQLKTINSDYHNKMTELKKHDEITVKEFKSQMSTLQKDHREKMQALLTPEQKNQLASMKQKGMKMAKANAEARAERMKIKLNLSDAQASQLKDMRSSTSAKIKSIHGDNNLSQDQKREQIKSLVTAQKDQLKTILTPEQMGQLKEMRGQHHRRDFTK